MDENEIRAQAARACPAGTPGNAIAGAGAPGASASGAGAETLSHKLLNAFDAFATHVTKWAGSPVAFTLALAAVLIWALAGPMFGYSETWQLVINTGTTIVTFLMVFLIQQSQNKDCRAVHLKLDELLHAIKNAREDMIDIENFSEEELDRLAEEFKKRRKEV